MLNLIIISVIAYLIGSIPFAFLFVKISKKTDIRNEGTGNVGAMNSYEVTGRKWVGIAVAVCDGLKGVISILLVALIDNYSYNAILLASIFSLLGHNYNIFLKLKGGRGLATAAGIFLCINPIVFFIWCIIWVISYFLIKRNVHIANALATLISPIILILIPNYIISTFSFFSITIGDYISLSAIICIIVLLRHISPIYSLIKSNE